MPKIRIFMRIWLKQANTWRYVPLDGGFKLDFIAAKGGELRKLSYHQMIPNEMIMNSEIQDAKTFGNIVIGRFSDAYSLDLLNFSRTQEYLGATIKVKTDQKCVELQIDYGKITFFARSNAKGLNYERFKISFASKDAKILHSAVTKATK